MSNTSALLQSIREEAAQVQSRLASGKQSSSVGVSAGVGASTVRLPGVPGVPGPQWFRPGHGFFHPHMLVAAAQRGMTVVLGSVYSHDPMLACTHRVLRRPVTAWHVWSISSRVQPGDICILHDRPNTVAILDQLLPRLRTKGLHVTSLSRM
jgi:hypothetical protein